MVELKIPDLVWLNNEHGSNQTLGGLLAEKMNKLPHRCPKCNGHAGAQVRYNAYPSNLPDSGWVDDWKYKWVDCDLCKGEGYTAQELVAKPVQVEYVTK